MLKKYLVKFKEVWETTDEEFRTELLMLMKGYMVRILCANNLAETIVEVEELFKEEFDELIESWENQEEVVTEEKKSAYLTYNEMYL